jgi:tetratricopeptide (TPR) repeat protein
MSWFGKEKGYDRARTLAAARRAAGRGAHAKSIALYQRVREVEPDNADLLRRIAVERARAGQREEALRDGRLAADELARRGFVEQAIGIYRDFANHFANEVSIWHAIAELELARKRPRDAVEVLLEGCRHFRSRARRADAVALLRRARSIDPTHFEASFQLAGLLAKSGATGAAQRMLELLAPHARSRRDRRRLRGRLFRLSPTPAAALRWLVAAFGG